MRVMITTGGTGGHISPALAVAEELRRRDPQLLLQWVGRSGGMEARICREREIPFRGLPVRGWPRGSKLRRIPVLARLGYSMARAAIYIRAFRPQLVLGFGGYVSLPAVYAAQRLGVATVLHEQNNRLGMANQMCAARAKRIFLSYEDTAGEYEPEKARVVGNPVRADFLEPPAQAAAREAFGLDAHTPVVLIVGGSQGAHSINVAVAAAARRLGPEQAQLLWMTGPGDETMARAAAEEAEARVVVQPYIRDMAAACAAADVVIGRAGASSTAEIAVMGKPSVLIPYPHATDNHQMQNARAFEAAGAATVLADADCTPDRLHGELVGLLQDPDRLSAMGQAALSLGKPQAAELIVEELLLLQYSGAGGAESSAD